MIPPVLPWSAAQDEAPQHLREEPLRRAQLVRGHFLDVRRDEVRLPDGGLATREYVVHPGAVAIVPWLDEHTLLLERQHRHPMGRAMLEFPAGKLDAGEGGLACAVRELREETGFVAAEWAYAGLMHPTIAYSTEGIQLWFARGLEAGPRRLDEGEFLDLVSVRMDQLLDACRDGLITDSKTLVAALWLQNVADGRWSLDWRPAPRPDDTVQRAPGR